MTQGFYKLQEQELYYAPNSVYGPLEEFELHKENKDNYIYPVDGWYWFNSEEEARVAFDLPLILPDVVIP